MKKSGITIMGLLLSIAIYGAGYTVPEQVRTVFKDMFPEVEQVHWEKWNDEVVAIFRDEEGLKKAFFSERGVWRETRRKLKVSELPIYVQTTLHERYPNLEITYAGRVYRAQETLYRVESESSEAVIVKLFEPGGMLLSEEYIYFTLPKVSVMGYVPSLPKREIKVEQGSPVLPRSAQR